MDSLNYGKSRGALVALVFAVGIAACGADSVETDNVSASPDIEAIVEDLNDFWSEWDDELGFTYRPVPASRITDGTDDVTCNLVPIEPAEVEDNAFVDPSCSEGITVAYDPIYVSRSMATAEATLAHEWGHVIQAQAEEIDLSLDPDGLPIDAELQADCFAGAWAALRADADIERLRTDVADAGDPEEVGVDDPHAHGTAAERVGAFDVGVDFGPSGCIDQLIDALPE